MDDSQFASNLQALMDMGFSETSALEALSVSVDIDSAIKYLFTMSESMPDPKAILYNPSQPPGPIYSAPPIANNNYYSSSKPQIPSPNLNTVLVPNQNSIYQPTFINSLPNPIQVNKINNELPQKVNLTPQIISPPISYSQNLSSEVPKSQPFPPQFTSIPIPNQFQPVSPKPNPFAPGTPNKLGPIQTPNPIQLKPSIQIPLIQPLSSKPQNAYFNPPFNPGSIHLGPKPRAAVQQNEDYIEFLKKSLEVRGTPSELIQEIIAGCSSKEEAFLILGIPISLKDQPLNEISVQYLNDEGINDGSRDDIMNELVNEGATVEEAYSISLSCDSLPQALQFYYDKIDSMSLDQHNKPMPVKSSSSLKPLSVPKLPYKNPHPPLPSGQPYLNAHPLLPPPPIIHPVKLAKSGGLSNFYPNIGGLDSYGSDDDFNYPNRKQNPGIVLSCPSESDPVAPDLKTEYFETLKDYRLIMSENPGAFRIFAHGNISSSSPQSLKRINNEIKTLQNSVPCDSTASIFVMIDTECMHRVKFLLSGTIDTPYAHGLYLFDVLLPANYPQNPPKVSILTTGNGKMRFNPNLYSNGYVCLSIINTWSGRPEEQWNPSSSTLLQVMLSIQSLVMDNDILQKEPSFHTLPRNSPENIGYQQEVMYGNMKYAMIEMIKNPPVGMEEIVRNHFRLKKIEILNTIKSWIESFKGAKRINNGTQNPGINAEINRITPEAAFGEAYNELGNLLKGF